MILILKILILVGIIPLEIVDISNVEEGECCPICGGKLTVTRGIEVGNIFKLGTKYSSSMKAKFLDENSKEHDIVMGCYGIGVGRLMASVVECTATEKRIIWPRSIAPFGVEIVGIHKDTDTQIITECQNLHEALTAAGVDVIYDDRNVSAGIKLNDADLIGSPIRVTIGAKSMANGGAEVSIDGGDSTIVPLDSLISYLKENKVY